MKHDFWNEWRIDQLRALWADGLSASQIAHEMGAESRSAIIGKVHRLGLSGRARQKTKPKINGWHKPQKKLTPSQMPTPRPIKEEKARGACACDFMELNMSNCHWPIENNKFCGEPSRKQPYCDFHHRRAKG